MPRLIGQTTEFQEVTFELTEAEMHLGRLPENPMCVAHGSVSGRHAVLTNVDGDYNVKDLNSTNGTRVNGTKVMQQKLTRGDMVQFGNIVFLYDSEVGGDAMPLPEAVRGLPLNPSNTSVRPADFKNTSPLGRRISDAEASPAKWITWGLGSLAVLSVGFMLFRMLFS